MNADVTEFTIPIVPVSKKNSQRIIINHRTGRPMILPSVKYKEYEKAAGEYVPKAEVDYECNVRCVFYMPTKRRVDLVNLLEAALDVLVKYGCLADDNSNIVAGMNGSCVLYSKDRPRTEITISRRTI